MGKESAKEEVARGVGWIWIIVVVAVLIAGFFYFSADSGNEVGGDEVVEIIMGENGEEIKVTAAGVRYIVDPDKIVKGIQRPGDVRDVIPSIDNPKFVSVLEADEWIEDNELVLALEYKGVKRVYPLQIMVWHEIVNDVVAGDPVLITYCPLCGSGIAFDPTIVGEPSDFGTSGKLHGNDGAVMSKSRGNVVLPEEVSNKYGIDTARLFLVSIASPDKDIEWSDKGVEGSLRFIMRIMNYFSKFKKGKDSKRIESKLNKTILDVTRNLGDIRYNFVVIKLRELFTAIEGEDSISKKSAETFLKLLNPICPHITEELWEKIGGKGLVSLSDWPKANEKKIDERFELAEKSLGKVVEDITNILRIVKEREKRSGKRAYLYVIPKELENYNAAEIGRRTGLDVKVWAVNDPKKKDPGKKAGKAKFGKPAIYVE